MDNAYTVAECKRQIKNANLRIAMLDKNNQHFAEVYKRALDTWEKRLVVAKATAARETWIEIMQDWTHEQLLYWLNRSHNPYQKDAIQWILEAENVCMECGKSIQIYPSGCSFNSWYPQEETCGCSEIEDDYLY